MTNQPDRDSATKKTGADTAQPKNAAASAGDHDDKEQSLVRYAGWVIPLGTVSAASLVGFVFDLGTAILVLAFGMLLGTLAIFWTSIRTLAGDLPPSLEDALAMASPVAAEQQKRAVLRALRDLEYERTMGKISEPDYAVLRDRYRAEGKRLLKALDDDLGPLRSKAETYIAQQTGGVVASPPAERNRHQCQQCSTVNDRDALFCKKCGAKLSRETPSSNHATA